jgi:hypothetical protein
MVNQPRRTRLTGACPRCTAPLRYYETGIVVDSLPEPVKWVPERRECSAGCLLTADDFSDAGS